MTDLTPITALGAATPRVQTFGAYVLRENSGLALASLAPAADGPAAKPFGLELPQPGRWSGDFADKSAFWMAPDQWMIEGADLAETDFAAAVLAETPSARISEQTDGWVAFEITAGSEAQISALLERLANVPPQTLTPGGATRTGFDHMSVYLLRRSDTHLSLIGMRSLATTLWHALETALQRLETRV